MLILIEPRATTASGFSLARPKDDDQSIWLGSSASRAMSLPEAIAVTVRVATALEKIGIVYAVGGSLASSAYGVPRSTQDADLLIELLVGLWNRSYWSSLQISYIDRDMILDAIRRRASFNIIHLQTMFKVDLFISDRKPFTPQRNGKTSTISAR